MWLGATLGVWLGVAAPPARAQAPGAARPDTVGEDAARRVRRTAVEHGLRAAVQLGGRPVNVWSLAARMQRYGVPGVSVAVIRGGAIDWAAGYGVVRAGPSVPGAGGPVTVATPFQAASISKLVTAVLALQLVEDGRLALDGDVNRWLLRWKLPAPGLPSAMASGTAPSGDVEAKARSTTLRQLLSHSAGVGVAGFPGYPAGSTLPSLPQILDGVPPANSPPVRVDGPAGRYRYSGGGYQIVQLLLEDVAGRPFAMLADERVLTRVGMTQSVFAPGPPPPRMAAHPDAAAPPAAAGHRFDGQPVPGDAHAYPELAAAALWSTPTDLARLTIAILQAYREADRGAPGDDAPRHAAQPVHPVLRPETAALMLTRTTGDAGLGPGVHGAGAGLHFDHAGWTQGFRAYLVAYPARGEGVVVMANHDGGHELIGEIVRGVAHTYGWPDFQPTRHPAASLATEPLRRRLRACTGTFRVRAADLRLTVRARPDHLVLHTPRGSTYPFHPTAVTPAALSFVAVEDGATLVASDGAGSAERAPSAPGAPCAALRLWGMVAERETPPA